MFYKKWSQICKGILLSDFRKQLNTHNMQAYKLDLDSHIIGNQKALIVVRRFSLDAPAQLCAMTLRASGIQCFVTNTMTASMLPMLENSIGVYIHSSDLVIATDVLYTADNASVDYRDADHDMIAYAKKLNQTNAKTIPNWSLFAIALVCIGLLCIKAILMFELF